MSGTGTNRVLIVMAALGVLVGVAGLAAALTAWVLLGDAPREPDPAAAGADITGDAGGTATDTPDAGPGAGGSVEPPPPPPDTTLDRDELERLHASTVLVTSWYAPRERAWADDLRDDELEPAYGSGFAVTPNGLIVTNAHVVQASMTTDATPAAHPALTWATRRTWILQRVTVRFRSGTKDSLEVPAQVLCTRPYPLDLALLRVRIDEPLPVVQAMNPTYRFTLPPTLTQPVWAVGFPMGGFLQEGLEGAGMGRNPDGPEPSLRAGSISAIRRNEHGQDVAIEHTCPIEPGNSGGPLVNALGQVVGINSFGLGQEGRYAIPRERILNEFFFTLNNNGYESMWRADGLPFRTLRVDPDADDPVTPHEHRDGRCRAGPPSGPFATIADALEDCHGGDTIALAAGTYTLTETLEIPAGLRIVGAGVGRTILAQADDAVMDKVVFMGGPQYAEIADLSIRAWRAPFALQLASDTSDATYVHDIEVVNESGGTLWNGGGGSVDVVNCVLRGDNWRRRTVLVRNPEDDDSGTRLEGVRVAGGSVRVLGAHAVLDGCRLSGGLVTTGTQSLLLRGCVAGGVVDLEATALISLESSTATLEDCAFVDLPEWRSRGGTSLGLTGASQASVTGCLFERYCVYALEVAGTSSASITGSHFAGLSPVRISDDARATVRACLWQWNGETNLRAFPVDGPRRLLYGVSVDGGECRLGDSLFRSAESWGVAVESTRGTLVDEGGNVVEGGRWTD